MWAKSVIVCREPIYFPGHLASYPGVFVINFCVPGTGGSGWRLRHGHTTSRKDRIAIILSGPALYNRIANRNAAAKIAQPRTTYCRLNGNLCCFSIRNTPYCKCGYGKERGGDHLLKCRSYREQREWLRREVETGNMRVGRLLGDPKITKHTLKYIEIIGRLDI